ncbi:MAG: response regulator, partial [Leptolyngbya sp. SIO1D8]|nr:response regulator [Leptolyngbya sp. SIO1D8]
MTKKRIRTLLIEDSGLMRIMISDILRSDPEIELMGTAKNGKEGFEKAKALQPDVVVTDMVMPEYDGLYAVKQIMKEIPTPIILLSSLEKTNSQIFDALDAGAMDFVDKPQGRDDKALRVSSSLLRRLIKSAAMINPATLVPGSVKKNTRKHTFSSHSNYHIIVIGASTGGPGAVEVIIKNLPANLSIPVVIAQHMPERFLKSFTGRLNEYTPLQVKTASADEKLRAGVVYVAPGRRNLKIVQDVATGEAKFGFTRRKFREFNEPSVDCLFSTAAQVFKNKVI